MFQNRVLLAAVAGRLEAAGLRVLVPERLPPNDGGISYGQAAVAAATVAAEAPDPDRSLTQALHPPPLAPACGGGSQSVSVR